MSKGLFELCPLLNQVLFLLLVKEADGGGREEEEKEMSDTTPTRGLSYLRASSVHGGLQLLQFCLVFLQRWRGRGRTAHLLLLTTSSLWSSPSSVSPAPSRPLPCSAAAPQAQIFWKGEEKGARQKLACLNHDIKKKKKWLCVPLLLILHCLQLLLREGKKECRKSSQTCP